MARKAIGSIAARRRWPILRRFLNPKEPTIKAKAVTGHNRPVGGASAALPVALIVIVVVTSCCGFPVTVDGENEQAVPAVKLLQLKLTCALNPNSESTESVLVADWDPVNESVVGESVIVKVGGNV
jgi:hypothetical protein